MFHWRCFTFEVLCDRAVSGDADDDPHSLNTTTIA
jgi:hypothetical protein